MNLSDFFGLPAPPPPPWEAFPASYGYIVRGQPVLCSRDELARVCEQERIPHQVWTPESGGLLPPQEVPFLLRAIRRRLSRAARGRTLLFALIGALLVTHEAGQSGLTLGSPAALYLGIVVALVGLTAHSWWKAARLTPEGFVALRREAEQAARVPRRPVVHTRWLVGMMVLGGAAQLLAAGGLVEPYGVMPAAVSAEPVLLGGEWWRLLTAAFVHYGPIHFGVNLMALLALGRETETYGGRGLLPLVFLVSVLGGSALGIVTPPPDPSVGNSGGLVGVIAFLGVLGWRRRHQVPPGFLNTVLINVALLVGIGVVGYAYVDNAGHAGGFIAGGLLGLALVPSAASRPHWEPGVRIAGAGLASLAVLAAAAAWTAFIVVTAA